MLLEMEEINYLYLFLDLYVLTTTTYMCVCDQLL
jgi:hypothetical protein